jgi:hypothetical protein
MGPHRSGGGRRHAGAKSDKPQVVHAPRSGGGNGGGGGADADGPAPSMARGFSRLDPATAAYYGEARDALAELEAAPPPFDKEQAGLLAAAALREAGGREAAVSADATGSRALEALLPHAPAEDVLAFASVVLGDGDALGDVATRCVLSVVTGVAASFFLFFIAAACLTPDHHLFSPPSLSPSHKQSIRVAHRRGPDRHPSPPGGRFCARPVE